VREQAGSCEVEPPNNRLKLAARACGGGRADGQSRAEFVRSNAFGVAINRGATAVIENNTIRDAAHSGIEVSQNRR
jgi:hypothetical protein